MIIVVCTDDPGLVRIAKLSANTHPAVFGRVYQVFTSPIPLLGAGEDLFIIAHGAYKGDDNNPVIGDSENAFYLNAAQLYDGLATLFPNGYHANIFVDACESADHTSATFSFTEVFLAQIQSRHGNVRVFGRNGSVRGQIPLPGDPAWREATH